MSSVTMANGTTIVKATKRIDGVNSARVISLMKIIFSVRSSNMPATINSKILSLILSFNAILFNSIPSPMKNPLVLFNLGKQDLEIFESSARFTKEKC